MQDSPFLSWQPLSVPRLTLTFFVDVFRRQHTPSQRFDLDGFPCSHRTLHYRLLPHRM